jgi:hypothetical protein
LQTGDTAPGIGLDAEELEARLVLGEGIIREEGCHAAAQVIAIGRG